MQVSSSEDILFVINKRSGDIHVSICPLVKRIHPSVMTQQ